MPLDGNNQRQSDHQDSHNRHLIAVVESINKRAETYGYRDGSGLVVQIEDVSVRKGKDREVTVDSIIPGERISLPCIGVLDFIEITLVVRRDDVDIKSDGGRITGEYDFNCPCRSSLIVFVPTDVKERADCLFRLTQGLCDDLVKKNLKEIIPGRDDVYLRYADQVWQLDESCIGWRDQFKLDAQGCRHFFGQAIVSRSGLPALAENFNKTGVYKGCMHLESFGFCSIENIKMLFDNACDGLAISLIERARAEHFIGTRDLDYTIENEGQYYTGGKIPEISSRRLKELADMYWNGQYASHYLKSPEWMERRNAKRRQSGDNCELMASHAGCKTHVHHTRYKDGDGPLMGRESLKHLMVLCEECHSWLHKVRQNGV